MAAATSQASVVTVAPVLKFAALTTTVASRAEMRGELPVDVAEFAQVSGVVAVQRSIGVQRVLRMICSAHVRRRSQ